jgi:thioredoxin-like negative regulator of GroEL
MANQYNTDQIKAIRPEGLRKIKKEFKNQPFLITFFRGSDNNSFLLESVLNKVARKYQDQIAFFRCTVKSAELAQLYFPDIDRLPSTVLVHNGRTRETFFGVLPQHKIEEKLKLVLEQ